MSGLTSISKLRGEVAALKIERRELIHDIEQYVKIADAYVTENAELRSALVDAITLAAAVWDEGHPTLQRARYALKSASSKRG
jgi:hypothetical protein